MRAKLNIHHRSSVALALVCSLALLPKLAPADLSAAADARPAEAREATTALLAEGPLEVLEDGNEQPFAPPSRSDGAVEPNDKQIKSPVVDWRLPRLTARIQRTPRFARAIWRMPDEKLKPRGAIGGEELALKGFEYRHTTSGGGAWNDWQVSERLHSQWTEDLSRGSEVAFQLRSLWRSQTGELLASPRVTLEDGVRAESGGARTECTTQPGRQPGVAYATGGERTYVPLTTNLCLASLLVEQTDLDSKVPGPDLQIKRTYNSYLAWAGGMLGFGWTSSLERSVVALPNGDALYEDGQGASFVFDKSGSTYTRPADLYLELRKLTDGRFTLTNKENVVETYSRTGQLASIIDPAGNTTTLTWFGDRLAQITDSAGRQTGLTYDGWGLLWKITDPTGEYVELGHNLGDLSSVSYPGDSDNPRRTTLFSYDAEHRLTRTGTPELVGRGDTVSDSDCGDKPGEATILYDAQGRVGSITNERHIVAPPMGDANQVELCGRPIGTSTTYLYEFGEQTCPDPVCVTDPREHLESYILDEGGRPQQVIDAEGRPTYLSYDSDSNLTEAIEFRASRQLKTELSYDSRGNLTSLKEPGHQDPTTFGYDERDNMVWKRTPGSQAPGSPAEPPGPLVPGSQGQRQVEAADQRRAGLAGDEIAGEDSGVWQYGYTPRDQLESLTTPSGARWSFTYDTAGNRAATTDPGGNRTAYTYDARGRLESITYPWSGLPAFAYEDRADPCGLSPGWRTRAGVAPLYAGTLWTVYTPDGSTGSQVSPLEPSWPPCEGGTGPTLDPAFETSVSFGTDGLVARRCSIFRSDVGPITGLIGAALIENLAYEANGAVASATSQNDIMFGYSTGCVPYAIDWWDFYATGVDLDSYTTHNQVDEETWSWLAQPGSSPEPTQYGEKYRTTYYAADGAVKDLKANDDEVMIQHHSHDAQDNDTRVERDLERVTQTSTFDEANRETSRRIEREGQPTPWLDEQYSYDEEERITEITAPGRRTAYEYDADGNLNAAEADGTTTRWTYDDAGNRLRERKTGDATRSYTYDSHGRLTAVDCGSGPCMEIRYDAAGRPYERVEMDSPLPGTYRYWWDALGRLARVERPDNRIVFISYRGSTNAIQSKRIYALPLDIGLPLLWLEYHYDAKGRVAAEIDRTDYHSPFVRAVYNYDGQGNLVSTSQPNGGQFKTYWYDFDALANLVGLNDEFERKNSYRYDPWGNLTSSSGSVYNPFRYKGAFWDEDLQMYYVGDRWYDPRIGRFISPSVMPDPNEDAEMVYDVANPYVFANNNPLKYRNPSGWPPSAQIRRLGLDYFRRPNRFRKERMPQLWDLKRRIELGSPSRDEGLR